MKSHVYLLPHRNGKRFKVGKANDIIQRARSFNLRDIDWTNSIGLEVQSVNAAVRLERILLRVFADWLLTPAEVLDDDGVLDGATEWMQIDCLPRMDDFLQHVKDLHPHARIHVDVLYRQVTELSARTLQAIAERERGKTEKAQRKEAWAMLQHAKEIASNAILKTALLQAKERLWRELEYQINAGTIVGMASEGHGWNLILLGQPLDDRIWRMGLQDTQFSWPRCSGGLVTSISEYECEDACVCVVGLDSCFYDSWPRRDVAASALADITEFLRSLLPVDLGRFKAKFEAGIWENYQSRHHSSEELQMFVDEHLPVLQMRNAARLSEPLF